MSVELWSPNAQDVEKSALSRFQKEVGVEGDFNHLHDWSINNSGEFWSKLFPFFDIDYEGSLEPACQNLNFDSYTWFPNVKLNFSENLLKGGKGPNIALNFVHESGLEKEVTFEDLREQTGSFQNFLRSFTQKDEVLACYMPNIPETVVSMLAATGLGMAFTSTSSDFGVEGVLDRFGQSRPSVLVAAIGYEYGGKYFDQTEKIKKIVDSLPFIKKIVIVDFLGKGGDVSSIPKAVSWEECLKEKSPPTFEKVSFSTPLYIMYSSGTTGKPKCIVHSHGGTLLQHVKEIGLHTGHNEETNLFYFTTCGWMMWNWLVSGLFFGGQVTLYEGSPGRPSLKGFLEIINKKNITFFGTSPKFLRALEESGYSLDLDFPSLKCLMSTGAPLLPEQYDYIYESFKKDIQVASICGGTDIIGCFMLGNPNLKVHRGEIQCLGLGMDVSCFNEKGQDVVNTEGELVCKKSFPSRPVYFLNDEGDEKIKKAYFNKFPGVWHHGDFVTLTDRKTVLVFGRSDATLNPGGVRIGTSEIYRQTEMLNYIEDSLCVGRPKEGDVEVVLFVKLKDGEELDESKVKEIKTQIRSNTTPRHVPTGIFQVSGIPYTRSGKKMELAVSRILQGRELTNVEAVSNPECLAEYKNYAT